MRRECGLMRSVGRVIRDDYGATQASLLPAHTSLSQAFPCRCARVPGEWTKPTRGCPSSWAWSPPLTKDLIGFSSLLLPPLLCKMLRKNSGRHSYVSGKPQRYHKFKPPRGIPNQHGTRGKPTKGQTTPHTTTHKQSHKPRRDPATDPRQARYIWRHVARYSVSPCTPRYATGRSSISTPHERRIQDDRTACTTCPRAL